MIDWDVDWTHDLLRQLLETVRARHRLELLGNAERALASGNRVAFIRHDVDMSLARARDLALLDRDWGVHATYHVMWKSPFYSPTTPSHQAEIREIASAGHEVGLHFVTPSPDAAPAVSDRAINDECAELEQVLGTAVRSISFHLPPPAMIGGPLVVCGRVNAYAATFLGWYLSDSRARWREGDPRESLKNPRGDVLQLLVHPIWWGAASERPEDRLGAFVAAHAREVARPYEEISDLAYAHILYRARKPR